MAFGILKLASGRTPDMMDRKIIPQNEILYGRALHYDSGTDQLEAVIGDMASPTPAANGVFGICMADPNMLIADGGGITFPLAASASDGVYPVVLRVYGDTLVEADVTGTIAIGAVEMDTFLAIDLTADGLIAGTTPVDFIVEEVLADDGTNVTKVSGYFLVTQIGS